MEFIIRSTSERGVTAKRMALSALVTSLMLGTFVANASAQQYHQDRRSEYHRDDRRDWSGGYYPAPPVVYGAPYYAPPPVVYGPSVGIVFPGVAVVVR